MPTVAVDKERLFAALGDPNMTIAAFDELCFDFGVELDDVTSEREMALKEHHGSLQASATSGPTSASSTTATTLSDRVILKIDVSANRYDLLCHEGLARALRIFLGRQQPPTYRAVLPAQPQRIRVKDSVGSIRPFVVAAVLRGVTFDAAAYASFIDLQDKLHQGLCRRRQKVAIGTHDLDTVQGPFSYEALAPEDISFVPLNQSHAMDGNQLMQFYETDRRLSKFLPIIRDSPVYPVVFDSRRRVLSLPPIINGDHSKISLKTRNVLIECTATEESKACTVLNMMVTMFSEYCSTPYSVEQVEVEYEKDGRVQVYPDLTPRTMNASVDYINSCIGTGFNLSDDQIRAFLAKMGMSSTMGVAEVSGERQVQVSVPVSRSDIMHACDIMEDVAVAFGINNIPRTVPSTSTFGAPFPLNKLTDLVRGELALAGWSEVLPLTLCSHDENFANLRRTDPGNEAVVLANPATVEYQVVRTSLLPGLLKTIAANKKSQLPLKLFEVGDVVLQDPTADRRARNERRACAVYVNRTSGFELVQGLLDRLMKQLMVERQLDGSTTPRPTNATEMVYSIRESDSPTYFAGRQADIVLNGERVIGTVGILHPEVLGHFDIQFPCSVFELCIEPFV